MASVQKNKCTCGLDIWYNDKSTGELQNLHPPYCAKNKPVTSWKQCNESSKTNYSSMVHKLECSKARYKCTFCSRSFGLKDSLKRHQLMSFCKDCQKCFLSPSHLQRHLPSHYETRQHFFCDKCGNRFHHKHTLANHQAKYCPGGLCTKVTTTEEMGRADSLSKENQDKEELPWRCVPCGRGFRFENSLINHKETCYCKVCKKCLGTGWNLRRHHVLHDDQRPYLCVHCGKRLYLESKLIKHQTSSCFFKDQGIDQASASIGKLDGSQESTPSVDLNKDKECAVLRNLSKDVVAAPEINGRTKELGMTVESDDNLVSSELSNSPELVRIDASGRDQSNKGHTCETEPLVTVDLNDAQKHTATVLNKGDEPAKVAGSNKSQESLMEVSASAVKLNYDKGSLGAVNCNVNQESAVIDRVHGNAVIAEVNKEQEIPRTAESNKDPRENSPPLEPEKKGNLSKESSYSKRKIKDVPFKCASCFRCFGSKCTLEKHKDQCACKDCQQCFGSPWNLEIHLSLHCKRQRSLSAHASNESVGLPYTCTCRRAFSSEDKFKHHREICYCKLCEKCLSTPSNLGRHLSLHENKQPYVCELCQKYFVTGLDLNNHKKMSGCCSTKVNESDQATSATEKQKDKGSVLEKPRSSAKPDLPYKCSSCRKDFLSAETLQRHKSTSYCKECERCYGSRYNLKRHLRIHSSNKQACTCKKCCKKFNSDSELANHHNECLSKVEANSLDSDLMRNLEQTASTSSEDLHFKCDFCPKRFRVKENLENHKKSCFCNECQKCFKVPWKFKYHLLKHTKERAFVCSHCKKAFYRKDTLNKHIRNVHSVEPQPHPELVNHQSATPSRLANIQEGGQESNATQGHSSAENNTNSKENQPYKCNSCQKSYRLEESLERHKKMCYCTECQKCFKFPWRLKYHRVRHTNERPFVCEVCDKAFCHKHNLYKHIRRTHDVDPTSKVPSDDRHKCDLCPRTFSRAVYLEKHQALRCLECKKCFKDKCTLESHLSTHRGEILHSCERCGKSFNTFQLLRAHVNQTICYKTSGENTSPCYKCTKTFRSTWHLKHHRCHFCDLCKNKVQNVDKHYLMFHTKRDYRCDKCEKRFYSQLSLSRHRERHDYDTNTCKECGETFTIRFHLDTHLRTQHNLKKFFSCSDCMQSFQYEWILERHKKSKPHLRQLSNSYKCSDCIKKFDSEAALNKHRQCHIQSAFPCKQCNKYFTAHSLLQIHLTVHSTAKPFACELCGTRFKLKHVLLRHLQTVHKEHKHACDNCGKCFFNRKELKKHVFKLCKDRDKRATRCEHCARTFLTRAFLVRHLRRIHPELKSYLCDQCGKTFRHGDYLASHQSISHTGEKYYKCGMCLRRFCHLTAVRLHATAVHPKKTSVAEDIVTHTNEIGQQSSCNTTCLTETGSHKKQKSHACENCQQIFVHRTALRLHVKAMHPKTSSVVYNVSEGHKQDSDGPFTCGHCQRPFVHRTALRLHTKAVHPKASTDVDNVSTGHQQGSAIGSDVSTEGVPTTKEGSSGRPFSCGSCQRSFVHRTALRLHTKAVHPKASTDVDNVSTGHQQGSAIGSDVSTKGLPATKEGSSGRPFSCWRCHRAFAHRMAMQHHVRVVHHETAAFVDNTYSTVLTNDAEEDLELSSSLPPLEWWDGCPLPLDIANEVLVSDMD